MLDFRIVVLHIDLQLTRVCFVHWGVLCAPHSFAIDEGVLCAPHRLAINEGVLCALGCALCST